MTYVVLVACLNARFTAGEPTREFGIDAGHIGGQIQVEDISSYRRLSIGGLIVATHGEDLEGPAPLKEPFDFQV